MAESYLTNHAKDRLKERAGISKSNDRILELALTRGISHSETKGKLNKYLTKLYFYNETANNIKVYQEKVFIFDDKVLITVLNLPNELKKYLK